MKKFQRVLSSILVLVIIVVFPVACSTNKEQNNETPVNAITPAPGQELTTDQESETIEESETAKPITIVDPAGNEITIPKEVNSIISLAPSITQVIVDLGLGDKIILVDANSKDLAGLPEGIEYVDMMSPDAEKMIASEPDIVLASEMTATGGTDPAEQLKTAGITLAYIPTSNSIEGIYSDIMFIAKVLKAEEKGQELVDRTKEKISEIAEIGKTIEDKKTVYFEIAAAPYI